MKALASEKYAHGLQAKKTRIKTGKSKTSKGKLSNIKITNWGKGTEKSSEEVDTVVYGGELPAANYAQKLAMLDKLTERSKLTKKDAVRIGRKVKRGIAKRHAAAFSKENSEIEKRAKNRKVSEDSAKMIREDRDSR